MPLPARAMTALTALDAVHKLELMNSVLERQYGEGRAGAPSGGER